MKFTNVAMAIGVALVVSGCGGGGSVPSPNSSSSPTVPGVTKVPPLKVFSTSYENKNLIKELK
jgi:hypothetical protein